MARTNSYACSECGSSFPRWLGRCTSCGEYGSVGEAKPAARKRQESGLSASLQPVTPDRPAQTAAQILATSHGNPSRITTGLPELDRILGGGLVVGSASLIAGQPGVGKSTLLIMVAHAIAASQQRPVLYVSAEESVSQLALRARRVGADSEFLHLADDTDLAVILGQIEAIDDLALVIVDSVQTVASAEVSGRAGGVAQVSEVSVALTRVAKQQSTCLILVGQVIKQNDAIGGPRQLEHLVDTVLMFSGDSRSTLRLLRVQKSRYAPADELAVYEHTESGLREVPDPSALFRAQREAPVPGAALTVAVEGRRALLVEVQALAATSTSPNPRRGTTGLDSARVAMLGAVVERHCGLRIGERDLFTGTVGGIRCPDPAADLAITLAIVTAITDDPLPLDVAVLGEVTLSGDIRPSPMMAARINEAVRQGCQVIMAPKGARDAVPGLARGIRIVEVQTVHEATAALPTLRKSAGRSSAEIRI